MDLNGYRFLLFIESIIDSISVIVSVPSFYNETYNESTLIMPLMDNDTRIPLTSNSSFAKQWCSSIDAILPRITNESDQRNIVQFIRNATMKYQFARGQDIFVNNIFHKTRNWTWVNGQINEGFAVKQENKEALGYFFGYLWTNDYRIKESQPLLAGGYICETPEQSSNSSLCKIKLGKRCYWKKSVTVTWYKARETCLTKGGDLASFEKLNETNLKVALKNLGLNARTSYWVGLSKSVWRWNDKDPDSEIKYSNWKAKHPSNYNAKCLCLNKQPTDYEWIECKCDKTYPFICKRKDVLSETGTHVLLPSLCCLIIIIIIVVVFFIQKHRNRLVNSSQDVTSQPKSAETARDNPVYAEIENLRENQSPTNCSESSTTYTALQFDPKTKKESLHENTVYAELDLTPKE